MMTILYGEEDGPLRDSYIANADQAVDGLVEAGNIGENLVDFIPLRQSSFGTNSSLFD